MLDSYRNKISSNLETCSLTCSLQICEWFISGFTSSMIFFPTFHLEKLWDSLCVRGWAKYFHTSHLILTVFCEWGNWCLPKHHPSIPRPSQETDPTPSSSSSSRSGSVWSKRNHLPLIGWGAQLSANQGVATLLPQQLVKKWHVTSSG